MMNFERFYKKGFSYPGEKDTMITHTTDLTGRFTVIQTLSTVDNTVYSPGYTAKNKVKIQIYLFDIVNKKTSQCKSRKEADKMVLEELVNSFFKDVENAIKSV